MHTRNWFRCETYFVANAFGSMKYELGLKLGSIIKNHESSPWDAIKLVKIWWQLSIKLVFFLLLTTFRHGLSLAYNIAGFKLIPIQKSGGTNCVLNIHSKIILTHKSVPYHTVTSISLYLLRSKSTAPLKYLCCYHIVPTQLECLCGYFKVTVELL